METYTECNIIVTFAGR